MPAACRSSKLRMNTAWPPYSARRNASHPVIPAIPLDEARQALVDRGLGAKAEFAGRGVDIGVGRDHVAGLHPHQIPAGGLAERTLEHGDEALELLAPVVAEVVDAVRRLGAGVRGGLREAGEHARHDVVDI